jgi:hypothetical protein
VFDQPAYDGLALIQRPKAFEPVRRLVVKHSPFRGALRAVAMRRLASAVRHRSGVGLAAALRLLLHTMR